MPENALFDNITLVLHQPRFAENIGASARAAWNMGLSHIILVNPEDTDWERMAKLSTHVARGLLEKMETYSSLAEALAPFHYIVGTTSRLGGQRKEVVTPSQAAEKIQTLGRQNRIAILFGPENRGLSNEELRFCHSTVHIPTASAGSLNLAQAVVILSYEIYLAHQREPLRIADCGLRNDINSDPEFPSPITHQPQPETLKPSSPNSPNSEIQDPKPGTRPDGIGMGVTSGNKSEISLASSFELEGMYRHLSEALQMMDFLDKQNPELWMMSLRRFFSRKGLYSHEVRMIRGICRQLKWFITRYRTQHDPQQTPKTED
jgi:tRNA/rRNA methyltransferase